MQETREKVKKFFNSKSFTKVLYILGSLLLASVIFNAGVFVGANKASFDKDWGENYMSNFGASNHKGLLDLDDLPNAHGAVGKVVDIALPTFIVADENNVEKSVFLADETKILNGREEVGRETIKVGDFAVVIGSPNNIGQIEAKFIRIMPYGTY